MERRNTDKSLIPWRFLRELDEPHDYLNSLFYRSVSPFFRGFPLEERYWGPAMEISEADDKYIIKAELPGMKRDEIEVTSIDHTLSIKGEKKHKEEVNEDGYYYSEVSYGSFHRTMTLPADVTTGKIVASYEDGVLVVNVPRTQESKPKKVVIESKKKDQTTQEK